MSFLETSSRLSKVNVMSQTVLSNLFHNFHIERFAEFALFSTVELTKQQYDC